jgi:hypothetical protein
MTSVTQTDGLIDKLAHQAGATRLPRPRTFNFVLSAATLASLGVSTALVLALVGARPDFAAAVHRAPFAYKIASMLMLSLGGLVLARRAALPGSGQLTPMAFLPAVLVLAFRAASDHSGLSMMGNSDISAHECILTILGVSLPPLAILLIVMRIGAPTQPAWAGAIAGSLSGALGATAYALACKNDAGLFVAIWYPVAILVMAALGAVIGKRALAW